MVDNNEHNTMAFSALVEEKLSRNINAPFTILYAKSQMPSRMKAIEKKNDYKWPSNESEY